VRPDPNASGKTALHSKYPARRDRRRLWPIYARTRKRNKPPGGGGGGDEDERADSTGISRAAKRYLARLLSEAGSIVHAKLHRNHMMAGAMRGT